MSFFILLNILINSLINNGNTTEVGIVYCVLTIIYNEYQDINGCNGIFYSMYTGVICK